MLEISMGFWRGILALFGFMILGSFAYGQSRCESVFAVEQSSVYGATRDFVENEFNRVLKDDQMNLVDRLVNQLADYTLADQKAFFELLSVMSTHDPLLKREVELALDRKVSDQEATALQFARGLGRTEPGLRDGLLAFSDNYTRDQISRKDRVLELAGFSFADRLALQGSKIVNDSLTRYAAENLYADQAEVTPTQAEAMNKAVLEQMKAISTENPGTGRKNSINSSEAKSIYEAVTRNPVTRLLNVKKYDPSGQLGFCFGRAMNSHLESLHRGVDNASIRKVYVVGQMKALVGDTVWTFHVATAVKNSEGGWWIIDPFFGKAVSIEKWYERMHKHDVDGKLRVYVTEPQRLTAGKSLRYDKEHLMSSWYNGYFKNLFEYYGQKARNELPAKPFYMKIFDWVLSVINLGI
jgi:hypothetical protein